MAVEFEDTAGNRLSSEEMRRLMAKCGDTFWDDLMNFDLTHLMQRFKSRKTEENT